MAKREYVLAPDETHGTADTATAQVTLLFDKNKCKADKIKADYGEDLLIQPTFNDQIEHFKMWVQLKGTADIETYRQASGDFVRYIDFAHMFKWLRSKELCVLVLWDVQKEHGLYYLPKDELDEWEFYTERKDTIRVSFNKSNIFNKDSIPLLLWRARYDHYAALSSHAQARMDCAVDEATEKHAHSMCVSVLIDFLLQVRIIEKVAEPGDVAEKTDVSKSGHWLLLSPVFRQRMMFLAERMQKDFPEDNMTHSMQSAIAVVLVATLEERTGTFGVPSELVVACVPVIEGVAQLI